MNRRKLLKKAWESLRSVAECVRQVVMTTILIQKLGGKSLTLNGLCVTNSQYFCLSSFNNYRSRIWRQNSWCCGNAWSAIVTKLKHPNTFEVLTGWRILKALTFWAIAKTWKWMAAITSIIITTLNIVFIVTNWVTFQVWAIT